MVQVAAGASDVRLDPDLMDHLGAPGDTLDIRGCWAVTTVEYRPVLLLELPDGLLVASPFTGDGAGDEAPITPVALRWDEVGMITLAERDWMLLIIPVRGTPLRLLFASLRELHRVAEHLSELRRAAPEPSGDLAWGQPLTPADDARDAGPCERCSGPTRPAHRSRLGGHAQVGHGPGPALDRIERRLVTVETLLADLTTPPHPRGI